MIIVHQALQYALTTNGAHGSAVIESDGRFVYTPSSVYHDADVVTYSITAAGGVTVAGQQLLIPANPEPVIPEPELDDEGMPIGEVEQVELQSDVRIISGTLPRQIVSGGEWVRFPGSPHLDVGKVRQLVASGVWTESDLERHGLEVATPFEVPEGYRTVGAETFEENGGNVVQIFATEPIPPPLKEELYAHLADVRWQKETGGITLPGNVVIQTDATSQSKIAQAIQSLDLGIVAEPLPWKTGSGFVLLTRADLVGIAAAVAAHVQTCFAIEAHAAELIASDAMTTFEQIDNADWPQGGGA